MGSDDVTTTNNHQYLIIAVEKDNSVTALHLLKDILTKVRYMGRQYLLQVLRKSVFQLISYNLSLHKNNQVSLQGEVNHITCHLKLAK